MEKKHTHVVLDLVYTPDEGQECFIGTLEECNEFVSKQGGSCHFTFKVAPIIPKINPTTLFHQKK